MSLQADTWVSRYVVALRDPLITLESRAEVEKAVVSLSRQDPHWMVVWVSGFLSDIVRSLDPDDPWRQLTVQDGKTLHPDGSPFGSYIDTTDIVHASHDDIRSDLGLAALEHRLDDKSAALIAVAGSGWKLTLEWLRANLVTDTVLDDVQGKVFFETIHSALRWSIHRRRLFVGWDDEFVPISGVAWTDRADKIITGEAWDEARAARFLKLAAQPQGTYAQFL